MKDLETRVTSEVGGEFVLHGLSDRLKDRLIAKMSLPLARKWGGFSSEPERLSCAIEMPDGSVHVPRGAVSFARKELESQEVRAVPSIDLRSIGTPIHGKAPEDRSPRDYQLAGVVALLTHTQGYIVLPCGGGKSLLGLLAILAVGRTTLVMVPTIDLAEQWQKEAEVGFHLYAGIVGDGRQEGDRDVVIGIAPSVRAMLDRDPKWGERFGFVIVDEAHRCPVETYQDCLRRLPARWRLGLTATPDREDDLGQLVEWSFGQVLLERTTKELIKAGFLMAAEIEMHETGFSWPKRAELEEASDKSRDGRRSPGERAGWKKAHTKLLAELEQAVSEDAHRSSIIADEVAREAKAGGTVLVLCRTRKQTEAMAELVCARGADALHVTGKSRKKVRRDGMAAWKAGELAVLCATSLADEGLDVPRLSSVHLAHPQKAQGTTTQRLGRLLRKWTGKKPKLHDWIDSLVPTLERRAASRRTVYRKAGLLGDER